jgi:protocatechuate 3,4-dioxygenase beta subunit
MMEQRDKKLTRRAVLGAGVSMPLGILAAPAIAAEMACAPTPRQTTGPFYPVYDQIDKDVDLTKLTGHGGRARGEVIRVTGRVLDETCTPVEGALVDLWQANARGRYAHPADPNPAPLDPNFQGWGQAVTDADGRYAFRTVKPAAYPLRFMSDGKADEEAGYRTPHLHFRVSKRGHAELATQMYFAGEALNEKDGVLRRVPEAERSSVVIVPRKGDGDEVPVLEFDLVVART